MEYIEYDEDDIKGNLLSRNETNKFECNICLKKLKCPASLRGHIKDQHHTLEKQHVCKECGQIFKHSSEMKNHIKAIHRGVKYKCDICGHALRSKMAIKGHISSVHDKITFKCDLCEKTFRNKWGLKRHKISIHVGEGRDFHVHYVHMKQGGNKI